MASNNVLAILQLLGARGVGPARVRRAISVANDRNCLLDELISDRCELSEILGPQIAAYVESSRASTIEEVTELEASGTKIVGLGDPDYPQRLLDVLDEHAPLVLTMRGNSKLLEMPSVGFCGSRNVSDRGLLAAQECAYALTLQGVNAVSGYAAGVDRTAHLSALENGGSTTIVLPEGISRFKIKKAYESAWDWERVLVVSEFLPSAPWSVSGAMQRNATICALSGAMLLIEARTGGGSFAAGLKSLELGIPLYVAIFEDYREESSGNRELLRRPETVRLSRSMSTGQPKIDGILASLQGWPRYMPTNSTEQLELFAVDTVPRESE